MEGFDAVNYKRNNVDAAETVDPTPQESQLASEVCLRILQFVAVLDKYQLRQCQQHFLQTFFLALDDAWSHEYILDVLRFAHQSLPSTSLTAPIHRRLHETCASRLNDLETEPLFRSLTQDDIDLASISSAKPNIMLRAHTGAGGTVHFFDAYCSGRRCRQNQWFWHEADSEVNWCNECCRSDTYHARKTRLWPHLDTDASSEPTRGEMKIPANLPAKLRCECSSA
jgi:hypothetical protein